MKYFYLSNKLFDNLCLKKRDCIAFLLICLFFNFSVFAQNTFTGDNLGATIDGSIIVESKANSSLTGDIGLDYVFNNVAIDITHSYDSDLNIQLESPSGTVLNLSMGNGGSGDNYTNTVFRDGGADISIASPPFTGTFEPQGGTFASTFNGESINGDWKLLIEDTYPTADDGTLNSFEITFALPPTCFEPENLAVSNITIDSADLNWDEENPNTATDGYEWVIMNSGDTPDTGNAVETGTVIGGVFSDSVSNLSAETKYDAYVRSICDNSSNEVSNWSFPVSFTTACLPFNIPFSEDFENSTNFDSLPADCWSVINTGSGDNLIEDFGGSPGKVYRLAPNGQPGDYLLISPQITELTTEGVKVSFKARTTSGSSIMQVGTMADVSDVNTFNTVDSKSVSSSFDFQNFETNIASGSDPYFAIRIAPGSVASTGAIYFDDFNFESLPDCPKPFNIEVSNVSTTDAMLNWGEETPSSASDGYEWVVMNSGIAPDTGNAAETGTVTNGTFSSSVSNLSVDQAYDAYVRSICDNNTNEVSEWSSAVSFVTACNASSIPFSEDFDSSSTGSGGNPNAPDCWRFINSGSGDTYVSGFGGQSSSQSYRLGNSSNPAGDYILISPEIANISSSGVQISFSVQANQGNELEIGTMSDFTTADTFSLIDTKTMSSSNYEDVEINIPGGGSDIYFAVKVGSNNFSFTSFNLDNFNFNEIPDCTKPLNLEISNITQTEAELSWDEEVPPTSINGYEWVIMPGGDAPDTVNSVKTGTEASGTFTANIIGLSSNTNYDAYVRSDCAGDGVSVWSNPLSFTTLCNAFSIPFTEDFSSSSSTESCWTVVDNNGDGDQWELDYGSNTLLGDEVAALNTDFNSGNNDDYLITPTINLTGNEQLRFSYRVQSSGEPNDFQVTLSTTGTNVANFTNTLLTLDSYSNTTYAEEIIDLSSFSGNVNIAFHVPNGGLDGWRLYIDDVNVEEIPTCFAPTNLAVSNVTDTAADLDWNEETPVSASAGYEWVIMNSGDTPDTGNAEATGTVSNGTFTANVTGLLAETDYDAYVRSDCGGGDKSDWSSEVSFTTQCNPFSISPSFTENFDTSMTGSGTNPNAPNCWNFINSGVGWTYVANFNSQSGSQSYRLSNNGDSTGDYMLISPEITELTTDGIQVSFSVKGEAGQDLEIGTIADPADASTFTLLNTETMSSSNYEDIEINISAGTDAYFAVKHGQTDTFDNYYLDDFSFDSLPICTTPKNFTVSNIVATAADLAWDEEDLSTATDGYEWVIMNSGDTPDTVNAEATGTVSNGTFTANVTGLLAETDYDAYVRSDCGGGDKSDWSSEVSFTTPCVAFIAPVSENFDGTGFNAGNDTIDDCWTRTNDGGSMGDWIVNSGSTTSSDTGPTDDVTSGGNYLFIEASSPANSGDQAFLNSPQIDLTQLTTPSMKISYHMYGSNMGTFSVEVKAVNAATYNTEFTITGEQQTANGDAFIEEFIDLSAYAGQTVDIRFVGERGNGFRSDIAIDEFIVQETPSCITPSNLQTSNITSTEVDLTWDEENPGTATNGYEWVVMSSGNTPDTGNAEATGTVSSGTFTANVTGLDEGESYDAYVRSDCGGDGFSDWSNPVNFTLMCNAFSVPFTENFDSSTAGSFNNPNAPNCWSFINTGIGQTYIYDSASNSQSGNQSYYLYNDFDSSSGDYMLISPEIAELTTDGIRVSFSVKGNSGQELEIGTISDPTDASTFTVLQTETLSSFNYEDIEINIPAGTDSYFAVKHGQTGSYDGYFLDDFSFDVLPTCTKPNNITESNITATTADLAWNEENPSTATDGYEWVVMNSGDTPDVGNAQATGTVTNGTLTANVTDLLEQSNYDAYVRSDCSNGDKSDWSNAVSFTTPCATFTAPYSENFDGVSEPDIPDCWNTAGNDASEVATEGFQSGLNDPPSSPNFIIFEGSNLDNGDEAILVSPPFSDLSDYDKRIRFKAAFEDGDVEDNKLFIGVMSDPTDASTFIEIEQVTSTSDGVYEEFTVNLNDSALIGSNQYIAIAAGQISYSDEIGLDDFVYEEIPSCVTPSNLQTINITSSDVDLTWDEENPITATNGYDWVVMSSGDTPDTGNAEATGTVSNGTLIANVTGLSFDTNYDAYVRSDCGGDVSNWSNPVSFFTGYCDSTPSSNDGNGISQIDFNGNVIPSGGDLTYEDFTSTTVDIQQAVTANLNITFVTGYTYDTNIWIDFNDNLTFESSELVFQGESTSNSPTTLDASFPVDVAANLGNHRMRIGTADSGQSTPEPCYTGSWGVTIDVIVNVIAAPSCISPTNLSASNMTDTTVDLAWDEENLSTATNGYEWVVMNSDDAPDIANAEATGIVSNGTLTANVTGLLAETNYDAYVRSDCGGGDKSDWSNAVSFTTPCTPFTAPYSENFDGVSEPAIPDCWNTAGNDANLVATEGFQSGLNDPPSSPNFIIFEGSNLDNGDEAILVSPPFSDLTDYDKRIRFKAAFEDGDIVDNKLFVGVMSDPTDASTFVEIEQVASTTDGIYEEYTINLTNSALIGSNQYIAIAAGSIFSSDEIGLDDFVYEEIPSCVTPSNLQTSNITSTDVDLSWNEEDPITATNGYEWVIMNSSDAPDTANAVDTGTVANGLFTANVTGLSSNTDFEAYVRSDCAGGDKSLWSSVASFTTLCVPFSVPFTENFDSSTAGSFNNPNAPDCWYFIDSGSGSAYISNSSFNSQSGNQSYYLYNKFDTWGDYMLISPEITKLTTDGIQVSFSVKGNSGQELEIGTMSDPADASTFTLLNTEILSSSSYEDIELNISAGADSYFAVKHGQTSTQDSYYLDDFSFDVLPTCTTPNNLTVSNITATSVDLVWNEENPSTATNGYEWVIMNSGDTPDTGNAEATGSVDNGTLTANITGLNPGTEYDAYVRSVCGVSDQSLWSDPVSFITNCNPESLPYTEDFESSGNFNSGFDICWSRTNTNEVFVNDASNCSEITSSYLQINGGTHTTETNVIDVSGESSIDISYEIFNGCDETADAGETLNVDYWDGSVWQNLISYDPANIPATGTLELFRVTSGLTGDFKLRFDRSGGSTGIDDLDIDNLEVKATPACPEPINLTNTSVTSSSADFSWNAVGNANNGYEWEIVPAGDGQGNNVVASGNESSTSFTATGLSGGSDYDAYVRTDCGGEQSLWSIPVSFTTFANGDVCDDALTLNVTSDDTSITSLSTSNANGSTLENNLYCDSFGTNYGLWYSFTAPSENLEFEAINGSPNITIFEGPDCDNLTEVTSGCLLNSGVITGLTSGNDYYALVWTDSPTANVDFSLYYILCPVPTNLSVSNITTTSADLNWTAETNASNGYNWAIVASGDDPNTDPFVASGNGVSSTGVSATGLSSATGYDAYVRSDCGVNGLSEWSAVESFTTNIKVPQGVTCNSGSSSTIFTAEFDDFTGFTGDTGTSNGTWQINSGGTSSNSTGPDSAHSGSNYAYVETSSGGTPPTELITPAIDLTNAVDGAELSFWIHAFGENIGTLDVEVGTSANGPFTTEDTFSSEFQNASGDAFLNAGVDLSSYLGQTIYLRFNYRDWSSFKGDLAIDLIEVNACGNFCITPENLVASNITSTSAQLDWDAETTASNGYEWVVMNSGDTPDTATAEKTGTVGSGIITDDVTGLYSGTDYDAYVRSDCGNGDKSAWYSSVSFSTLADGDVCDDALSLNVTTDDTNITSLSTSNANGSTIENNLDCDSSGPNYGLWYSFTAPFENLEFEAINGSPDITIFEGPDCDNLTEITSGCLTSSGTITGLTSGNDYYALVWTDSPTANVNFSLYYISCPVPTNLTVSNLTTTSADLDWDAVNSASNGYDWAIVTSGGDPDINTLIASGNGVSGTSASASGLSPDTNYDAYVRSDCSGGDKSDWSNAVSFTTNSNCDSVTQYFEFTGNTGFQNTVVQPLSGAPDDTYTFEVNYFDDNNQMPPFGFPRVIVDYNSDGDYNGQFDRTVILSPSDPNDTDLTDGKTYVGSITPLEVHQNYQVLVQSFAQGCDIEFGPFDAPDVLAQPDVEIFSSDISFSDNNPDVNSPLTVSAVVHNAGDLPAEDFYVRLESQFDNTVYQDIFVDFIPPNSSVTVDWPITTPPVDAFVPMKVTIDKTDVIAESNELDNDAIRPYINGDFNVPGSIDVSASVTPSSGLTYTNFVVFGSANYSDMAVPLTDPSVQGAEVSIFVPELGETFVSYTNNVGSFSISIPNGNYIAPGNYTYQGTVTDFTLQESFTGQFTVQSPDCPKNLVATVYFSPNSILDIGNSSSSLNISVSNNGCEDVVQSTNLSITQDSGFTDIPDNVTIPPLQVGESHQISFDNLQFNSAGVYGASVQADSNDIVNEVSESDNTDYAGISVLIPKPDLVLNGGPIGNLLLCQNSGQDITFTIRNIGNVPTSNDFTTTIDVFKDGTLLNTYQEVYNGNIGVSGTGSVSIPNVYNGVGNYSFDVDIDTLNEVNELNESNNTGSGSKNVSGCKPDLSTSFCHNGLVVSPIDPLDSSNVTYSAVIRNTGEIATQNSFNVSFEVDSPGGINTYPYTFSGSLGANSSTVVSVTAPLAPEGSVLTVVVDSSDAIDEHFETNNSRDIDLCHEFSLTSNGGSFWGNSAFYQYENVVPNVLVDVDNAYTASEVDVKFEVSGPGISGTADLGTVSVNDVDGCDNLIGVELPTSFVFNDIGTYTFTFTVDPDNEYLECDDTNNVFTRDIEVQSKADMRTLSEFINPSVLNPNVNEPVTLDVSYENLGFQNVNDEMKLKVFVNENELSTISNVPGLLSGENNTITVPVPFQSDITGANLIKVFIDADDEIDELDETNNEATRAIIVGDASNLYFESFVALNQVSGNDDDLQLQAMVGNDGVLDTEAQLKFSYFTPGGTEISIGQMPIQMSAGSTSSFSMNWTATNPQALVKAEILNSTVPEYNELDNVITLQNRVDFSLQNPIPQNLSVQAGDNLDINVDVTTSFNTIPFVIDDVQLSAYLSTDCALDLNSDQLLGSTPLDFALDQNNVTGTLNIDIPSNINDNDYNIIWVVDDNEQFEESDETNNEICINVNANDSNPPNVITQDVIIELDVNGQASITPEDIDDGSTDDESSPGSLVKELDITSFDCSNLGSNTVNLTVTDNSGNSGVASATVTVEDNIDPVAEAQNITVFLDTNNQATIDVTDIDDGSTDNCAINTSVLDITSFDCSNLGSNDVTLTVTDASGNSDTAMANVTIISLAPIEFYYTLLNAYSADFSWTPSNNANDGYEIRVFNFGDDPSNGTPVSTETISNGTVTAATVTGLSPETDYQAYIRSNFGGGNYSCWEGPVSFTTDPDYCGGALTTDSGGPLEDYPNNAYEITTICPDNPGDKVVINFSEFSFEDSSAGCNDGLTIYDGDNTFASTFDPPGGGTQWCWDRDDAMPGGTGDLLGRSIAATSASGCITLVLNSNGSQTREGFTARVSCESTVYLWNGSAWTTSPEGSITTVSNLYVNSGGTPSLTDGISTKSVFIDNGATLNASSGNIGVDQDLNNYGSITGSSDVLMNGSSVQSIIGSGSISNLTVDNGNSVSIDGKQDLTGILSLTNGDINVTSNSNLTFKSDASGTAQLADATGNSITGDVTVERFIPVYTEDTRAFRFLTSAVDSNDPIRANWQEGVNNTGNNFPADNQNPNPGFGTHITGTNLGTALGFDASISGVPSMYTFDNSFTGADQSNAWNAIPNTNSRKLYAGEAYRIFIRGDRGYDLNSDPVDDPNNDVTLRATGDLVIGSYTHALSDVAGYYSLIGNPYQAVVDFNNLTSTNVKTSNYYVWDPNMSNLGAYVTHNLSSGTNNLSSSAANEFIMPGQSILVQTDNSASSSLEFTEAAKDVTAGQTSVFSDGTDPSYINLLLYKDQDLTNGGTESDGLLMIFSQNGNDAVDLMDAGKLGNPGENLARLNNGHYLSVEDRSLPSDMEILELFTSGYSVTDYTFSLNTNNLSDDVDVYLIDNHTGDQTLMSGNSNQYSFTVDTSIPGSIAVDRFSIQFEVETFGVDDNELGSSFTVYPNPVTDDQIRIIASQMAGDNVKVIMYDMIGKSLMQTKGTFESNGEMQLDIGTYQAGVYFIEVINDGKSAKEKLIIK